MQVTVQCIPRNERLIGFRGDGGSLLFATINPLERVKFAPRKTVWVIPPATNQKHHMVIGAYSMWGVRYA